jgi:predicted ATPase/class 3 adenylate cyclase/tetratricopeptide (TPR) repeat protein
MPTPHVGNGHPALVRSRIAVRLPEQGSVDLARHAGLATPGERRWQRPYAAFMSPGTVTVVFTDLVGSTELLVALGELRFDQIRDEHDTLVGGSINAHRGGIVKHTGDGYMAAFATANDALGAAIDIQRRLVARNARSDVPLAVRIGISTGAATKRSGDYHGVVPVEAARLCAAATGGQILAAAVVSRLVTTGEDVDLVPLGVLDLKGLPPVATVAVRWGADAPVHRPAGSVGNLPASLDRFIGRETELETLPTLLADHRLLSLTGPGGSGKTRLALEVARSVAPNFGDGVWLVELAAVDDESLIAETTVAALGLRPSDLRSIDQLEAHLETQHVLLLIDNCEHVVDGAAGFCARLLSACPRAHILTTSREPLRVPGEREHCVDPLSPDEAADLLRERAPDGNRLADASADAIERICTAVAGIPLAVELAAARLRVLSPDQLAERLDDQLGILTQGGRTRPGRQQTLRATLDWSHNLLSEDERIVFRRLATFAGGFTLDAADQVVAGDEVGGGHVIEVIEDLCARSLIARSTSGATQRLRLLEPVRQYAAEWLDKAGERDMVAARHVTWCVGMTRRASGEIFVSPGTAMARIDADHGNISAALEYALGTGNVVSATRIVDALGFVWFTRGRPDAFYWCERVLRVLPKNAPPRARAGALVAAAIFLQEQVEYERAVALLLEAHDLYQSMGNTPGEAWTSIWLGRAAFVTNVANTPLDVWYSRALEHYRANGIQVGVAWCVAVLAGAARTAGDSELARARGEEALQLGRSAGVDLVVGESLRVLALLDADVGDFSLAEARVAEMIRLHEESGDSYQLVNAHLAAAEIAVQARRVSRAASHVLLAAHLARGTGSGERVLDVIAAATLTLFTARRYADSALLAGVYDSAFRSHRFVALDLYRPVRGPRARMIEGPLASAKAYKAAFEAGRALSLPDAMDRACEMLTPLR